MPGTQDRVYSCLQGGDLYRVEIERKLGLTSNQVKNALNRLRRKNEVKFDGLKWGIKSRDEQQKIHNRQVFCVSTQDAGNAEVATRGDT